MHASENRLLPQDFFNLIRSGGVAMVVIVGSALLALAVTVDRVIALWGVVGNARELGDAVARHLFRGELAEGRAVCERSRTPAADIFLAAFARLGRGDFDHVEAAVDRERQAVGLRLRSHLWILGTVGAVAPFVGLFGTIVGIMRAFHQIFATGQGGFAVVAEGISEALVTTAGGIVAAVLAVVLYNYFQSRLQRTQTELKLVADEFLEVLKERQGLPQPVPTTTSNPGVMPAVTPAATPEKA
jgi:biopolymer transport protein ExbB